jgi:hypothetical protein
MFYPKGINMEYFPHPALVVRDSKTHGLGVYTREALPAGTIIERCPILESMVRRTPEHPRSAMDRYTFFCWAPYPDIGFMPAGFGTMYNDAGRCCNVRHSLDMDKRCLTFSTTRDIDAGQELLMDYKQNSRPEILCGLVETDKHGQAEGAPQIDSCPTSTLDESAQGWSTR